MDAVNRIRNLGCAVEPRTITPSPDAIAAGLAYAVFWLRFHARAPGERFEFN
jgi:hypothetical protein